VACLSSKTDDVTAGEPLSVANIAHKLHNEFVICIVDLLAIVVEGLQLLLTVDALKH